MSLIDDERPQVNECCAKLIKAKAQFGKALKNAKNPHFKNNYADLQSVLDAVTVALLENDLFVTQTGERSGDMFVIRTQVFDSNGDYVDLGIMPVKTIKDDAQAFGSGLTYARRYALMSAFGLAPEDDDGQLASIASPADALRQQVAKLGKECLDLGIQLNEVQGALKGVEAKNLTEHQAHLAIESLTKIIEMTKKGKA
jgi:DNA-binding FrmR family transcriptional regulator